MRGGASTDPKWIENEIEMLEKTLGMYQIYAASAAKNKQEQEGWKKRVAGLEERIEEAKKKLGKARKIYALRVGA